MDFEYIDIEDYINPKNKWFEASDIIGTIKDIEVEIKELERKNDSLDDDIIAERVDELKQLVTVLKKFPTGNKNLVFYKEEIITKKWVKELWCKTQGEKEIWDFLSEYADEDELIADVHRNLNKVEVGDETYYYE